LSSVAAAVLYAEVAFGQYRAGLNPGLRLDDQLILLTGCIVLFVFFLIGSYYNDLRWFMAPVLAFALVVFAPTPSFESWYLNGLHQRLVHQGLDVPALKAWHETVPANTVLGPATLPAVTRPLRPVAAETNANRDLKVRLGIEDARHCALVLTHNPDYVSRFAVRYRIAPGVVLVTVASERP